MREIHLLFRNNAALLRQLKSISICLRSDVDVRLVRRARKQGSELAASLRWLLIVTPWIEHEWQQYRLEHRIHDYPTLSVFVDVLDLLCGQLYYVEARLKQEHKARKP